MKLYLANKADLEPNDIYYICLEPVSLTRKSMAILLPTLLAVVVFVIKNVTKNFKLGFQEKENPSIL